MKTVSQRDELAADLARGGAVLPVGGGTKRGWGPSPPEGARELSTRGLNRILEHNAGDLTAVLEAGVPLADAQRAFASAGQRIALDPPLGEEDAATIGGVVATADSGPLRSRFGAARDLVIGIAVALPDGTIARAGGKVIKNVAGYDLAKLFAGSFGTLGVIVEVAVRLHPLPERTVTAVGSSGDPAALARAAAALARAPFEHEGLDVRFGGGDGALLVRFAGAAPKSQAEAALGPLRAEGLHTALVEEDEAVWQLQRAGQRSAGGTVVRVSSLQTQLLGVLSAAGRLGGRVVGRAPAGISYVRLADRSAADALAAVEQLRRDLAPASCVVLDGPPELRASAWRPLDDGVARLMARVKQRFDPAGVLPAAA
jgi:glycolate oxidase FAD binding subunit